MDLVLAMAFVLHSMFQQTRFVFVECVFKKCCYLRKSLAATANGNIPTELTTWPVEIQHKFSKNYDDEYNGTLRIDQYIGWSVERLESLNKTMLKGTQQVCILRRVFVSRMYTKSQAQMPAVTNP